METVQFTRMRGWARGRSTATSNGSRRPYIARLPDRILAALGSLDDGLDGYQVTRLQHSLQTATRAQADGADIEMVVAALIHDIGDELAPENHSQLAAAIIRPYVRPEITWIVSMHGLFQLQYYGHHIGLDPAGRDEYRDHPWYDTCDQFCALGIRPRSTRTTRPSPSSTFEPLVSEVFTRPAFHPDIIQE